MKFTPLKILVMVIAGAAVLAGIFALTQFHHQPASPQVLQQQPTPPPTTPPQDATANWNVYQNDKYKFSFSYSGRIQEGSAQDPREEWPYGDGKTPLLFLNFFSNIPPLDETLILQIGVFATHDIESFARARRIENTFSEGTPSGEGMPSQEQINSVLIKNAQCENRTGYVLYAPGSMGVAYTIEFLVPLSDEYVLDMIAIAPDSTADMLKPMQDRVDEVVGTLKINGIDANCGNPYANEIR